MSRVPTNNNTFSSIKIRENINSGTDKITISASNIDSDYTLTLPPNDGNTDQVLTTNGSGILSWEDQSGGGGNSVLITGDQTISGDKTFNSNIIGSISGNADTATKITSITNSDIVQLTDTQTLTNKTLTSPTITGTGAIAGTFTGDVTGDVTGNADTATKIASITNIDIVQLASAQTLTNKTLTTVPLLGFTENITFTPSENILKLSGLSSGGLTCDGDITAFKSSDKRLKDNIVKIENPIEKIKKIGGYNFKWNKLGEKNTINKGKDIGLIAQEIEDVFPEATTTRDNGYKAVQYEKMIPLLVECIKEHQNMIENLQGQVDKLKIR